MGRVSIDRGVGERTGIDIEDAFLWHVWLQLRLLFSSNAPVERCNTSLTDVSSAFGLRQKNRSFFLEITLLLELVATHHIVIFILHLFPVIFSYLLNLLLFLNKNGVQRL